MEILKYPESSVKVVLLFKKRNRSVNDRPAILIKKHAKSDVSH